jgi:ferredoxin
MKIEVVEGMCSGHGRCWTLAPDVFDMDDVGAVLADEDGIIRVAEGQEANAMKGVRTCPEKALVVLDDE